MAEFETSFSVPEDLTEVTDLDGLQGQIVLAHAKLKDEPVTPAVVERKAFLLDSLKRVKTERTTRKELADKSAAADDEFNSLTAEPAAETTETPEEPAEEAAPEAPAEVPAEEPVAPTDKPVETPAAAVATETEPPSTTPAVETPAVSEVPAAAAAEERAPATTTEREPVAASQKSMSEMGGATKAPPPATRAPVMFASGDAAEHKIGEPLTLAKLAGELIAGFEAGGSGTKQLARINKTFAAEFYTEDQDVTKVARHAAEVATRDEVNYAVTCAPPQQLETICNRVDPNEGIATFPTIGLTRETITWRRGIDWCDEAFGTGYGTWTDEMREDPDAIKECADVSCLPGGECTVLPDWFCVDTDIMMNRFDRPAVEDFLEKLVARYNRWRNRKRLIDLVAIGLANQPGGLPIELPAKFGMTARLADAFLLAAVDTRMREGMSRTAPIHIKAPWETPEMMMAAEGYRDDWETLRAAMGDVTSRVAKHGVTVEWVHDLQPVGTSSPGEAPSVCSADFLTDWPESLRFVSQPLGAVVSAEADIININTVYDSPSLARNMFKLRFNESTYCMIDLCPGTRVYEVPVCTNGTVGGRNQTTESVDCEA